MWKYGVVHLSILCTMYYFFGLFYGIIALIPFVYCADKILDCFGYIRLSSGDLFTTFEGPNQNHNCGGYFIMKKIAFEEFRQTVYKKFILNIRKASMIQIKRFGFKLWEDIDKEKALNQILLCKFKFKTESELMEYSNNICNEDMDYSKPLWEFHFIENFTDDSSAVVLRVHHSFGDAVGFAIIMSCLNDDQFVHKIGKRPPSINLIQKAILVLVTPFYIIYSMIVTSKIVSDPKVACINELNKEEQKVCNKCYVSEKLAFEDVRKCYKKYEGTTFNDYMLAILSVCITKWCAANGIYNVKNVKMRYPVSMKSLPENLKEANLDNNLTTVIYNLPLCERIDQCLDYLKNNKNQFLNFKFLTCQSYFRNIFPYLPEIVIEKMFNNSTDSVYLLFTNIPLPSESFYICNREVTDMCVFGNYYGNLRTNFGAMTYKGKLQFMNMTDKNMKMNPQQLLDLVVQEIQLQKAESKSS